MTHEASQREIADVLAVDVTAGTLLDRVRRKRNQITYELAGSTSTAEADELLTLVTALRERVLAWLDVKHAALSIHGHRP